MWEHSPLLPDGILLSFFILLLLNGFKNLYNLSELLGTAGLQWLLEGVSTAAKPLAQARSIDVGGYLWVLPPEGVAEAEQVAVLLLVDVKSGVLLELVAEVLGKGEKLILGEVLCAGKLSPYKATHEV